MSEHPDQFQDTIRAMTHADLDSVMEIETSVHVAPWTKQIFIDCLQVSYSCWVVVRNENIVAFAVAGIAVEECHVFNISVALHVQRQGIGRRLMCHLLEEARLHAAKKVLLEVRKSNLAALTLYHQLGFHVIATRKDYYRTATGREDAWLLEAIL